jgi:hypothetical protein
MTTTQLRLEAFGNIIVNIAPAKIIYFLSFASAKFLTMILPRPDITTRPSRDLPLPGQF